jgi:hypothetical protein
MNSEAYLTERVTLLLRLPIKSRGAVAVEFVCADITIQRLEFWVRGNNCGIYWWKHDHGRLEGLKG